MPSDTDEKPVTEEYLTAVLAFASDDQRLRKTSINALIAAYRYDVRRLVAEVRRLDEELQNAAPVRE